MERTDRQLGPAGGSGVHLEGTDRQLGPAVGSVVNWKVPQVPCSESRRRMISALSAGPRRTVASEWSAQRTPGAELVSKAKVSVSSAELSIRRNRKISSVGA